MTGAGFVPELSIEIDGQPIPAELRACVSGVSHQSAIEGSDRVDVTVVNENLRWLDHPLLALDKPLELTLGYADGEMARVFVGEIVGHQATFPSGGAPQLVVSAQDRMHRLEAGSKVRWFGVPIPSVGNYPLPDVAVANLVALENGLLPVMDPIGAALGVLLGGVTAVMVLANPDQGQALIRKQASESDYELLARIARESGWEMTIDHAGSQGGHKLAFRSPLGHLAADMTLTYGRDLLDFTPTITSVGQIEAVSVFIYRPEIHMTFVVTVGWDFDRSALTLSIVPSLVPWQSVGPSKVCINEPMDPFSAPAKIIGTLLPTLNGRQTGSGSIVGNPKLTPFSVLQMEGLGEEFGGRYRVTAVTHNLDASGFITSFEARKEIWFKGIPKREQGAVPLRLESPAVDWSGRVQSGR